MKAKTNSYEEIHVDFGNGEELLPHRVRLEEILEQIRDEERALIIVVDARDESGASFMQAARYDEETWLVEARNGSPSRHYQASHRLPFNLVHDLLTRYASRDKHWMAAIDGLVWRKLNLK